MGDGGVGRKEENVGEIVAEVKSRSAEIKDGGDKDDTVQVHALFVVQISGKARGASRAVAFAQEIFGGHPAAILTAEAHDEVAHGFDVFFQAVEFVLVLKIGGAGEARADRVDEDQVGDIKERFLVVHYFKGRLGGGAVGIHFAASGAESAHMQPDGGTARTAVVDEDNGAAGLVLYAVFFVIGEKDLGLYFALVLVLPKKERSGGRGVIQFRVPKGKGMLGLYPLFLLFFGRDGLFFFFVFHLFACVII